MYEALSRSISEQFNNTRTATRCETRFKTIKKRKTEARIHNKTSGNTRKNVLFKNEFEQIAALNDSIELEIMMGVLAVQVNAKRKIVKEDENRSLKYLKERSRYQMPTFYEIFISNEKRIKIDDMQKNLLSLKNCLKRI